MNNFISFGLFFLKYILLHIFLDWRMYEHGIIWKLKKKKKQKHEATMIRTVSLWNTAAMDVYLAFHIECMSLPYSYYHYACIHYHANGLEPLLKNLALLRISLKFNKYDNL